MDAANLKGKSAVVQDMLLETGVALIGVARNPLRGVALLAQPVTTSA